MAETAKLLLIVTAPDGLVVRDTPRSQTQGALRRRVEPVGAQLLAYSKHNIGGVPYARLVPRNPAQPEWVRVQEADGLTRYADVIDLDGGEDVVCLHDDSDALADAIRYFADKLHEALAK
jgi:hypothetical protein